MRGWDEIDGLIVEGSWRFFKSAIDDWLRAKDMRSVLLQQAGVFADDETLPLLRDEIYEARQRPEAEF
jgi:hypothetical protein